MILCSWKGLVSHQAYMHDKMIPGKEKRYHPWKVGTINIQSCSDDVRLDFAIKECKQANLDVVCFQEVRRLKIDNAYHLGYKFYWCGQKRYLRSGVGIAIRDCPEIELNSIINVNDRLIAADITVCGFKLRVISCYAPTSDYSYASKQAFYRELTKLSNINDKNRKLLIQGDFNAEMQISREHSCFDGRSTNINEGLNQSNENAMLFLQYCHINDLSILNTWFCHPIHHRVTWHCPNGAKKVYDYSLSGSWLRTFVLDVRVRNSYFHSDHKLVVTKLLTPANKVARSFKRKNTKSKPNLQLIREDQDQTIITKVKNMVEEEVNKVDPTIINIDQMHKQLIDCLKKGREMVPPKPRRTNTIPWHSDEELSELILQRKHLRKQNVHDVNQNHIKEITKKIKLKVKGIRNQLLKTKAQSINQAKEQRKVAKLWREARNHDKVIYRKPKPLLCPGLATHFKNHFSPNHSNLNTPHEIQHPPAFIQSLRYLTSTIKQEPPNREEISNAIKQLNTGKSTIDIEAEIIKCAEDVPQFIDHLERYYNKIWIQTEVPNQWRVSGISPIWKNKGSALDATKYRGISIGSTLCKIGMNIILKRTTSFYDKQLKQNQYGFRSGVGCNDAIYVIKQLHEIASLSERELFVCFVDLSSAFDHVNRKLLFKTIRNRLPQNFSSTNIDIIENLYTDTKSFLRTENHHNTFPIKSGVRQGATEGPPLYNLYSDYSLRVYDNRKVEAGLTGLSIPYQIPQEATNREQRLYAPSTGTTDDDDVGYADDLALFAWNIEELQECINILVKVFEEFGLQINKSKTETMIINARTTPPESIISINQISIKNTTEFKYLGVWTSSDTLHIGSKEIDYRINLAHNAFAENRKMFTNFNIPLQTRIQFLNALVRTRLTYGCHCWRPSTQELSKLQSAYHYFLRCMVYNGHKRVNPPTNQLPNSQISSDNDSDDEEESDWRYIINNERLFHITKVQSIKEYYEQQQQNFVSHIIRRENNNLAKKLMFHNERNIKRGRKSPSILEKVIKRSGFGKSEFIKLSFKKKNHQLSNVRS